jgi:2,4-dienoyl-CoA reductase-like NADH-dependent reductase (Old Yellow Enzyme family)
MSTLFTPCTLRGLTLPNRIVVSPMCQYIAENGDANDWHLGHLSGLSHSGAGLLLIEATAVTPGGRITPADLGLWSDANEHALSSVLNAVRQYSRIAIGIQLAHAGRKASSRVPWKGGQFIAEHDGGWLPIAPSPVPHHEDEPAPFALDDQGLQRIREAFADATRRAARLGLDAIEIHAAHGYLLHEFLSPIANERTDAYGGSLDNRMRFPLEIFDVVRENFPNEKPVGVKISATDWVEGGWDLDQSVRFAEALKQRGADWVTASSGGVSPRQQIHAAPGYQLPFAERIKAETAITTMAVGLITDPMQADSIISTGQADLVAIARGMLYNPRWGWHAAAALGATVEAPPPYWRAPPHGHHDLFQATSFGAR